MARSFGFLELTITWCGGSSCDTKQTACAPDGNDDGGNQKPNSASTINRRARDDDERRQSNKVDRLQIIRDKPHEVISVAFAVNNHTLQPKNASAPKGSCIKRLYLMTNLFAVKLRYMNIVMWGNTPALFRIVLPSVPPHKT